MMVSLEQIYEPVKDDLVQVDKAIEAAVDIESGFVSSLLGHVLKGGGKRMRPVITLLAAKFHTYDLDTLVHQAAAVEVLHTATLVHDDAIDRSATRRGKVTVSAGWGDSRAILLGDYLLAKAAELCAMTENPHVVRLCARTLMIISSGELEQSAFTFDLGQAKSQYYRWIAAKTAALFAMAAESVGVLSGAPEKEVAMLKDYGQNLGMAFQVIDDILDFSGDETLMGKPTGEDLRQGVITLPGILYIEKNHSDSLVKEIFEIVASRDTGKLRELTSRIRESPHIAESHKIAESYSGKARRALAGMPDGKPRKCLTDLVDYALERKK